MSCVDAAVLQDGVQVGGEERALAGLVDHRLARQRIELGDDVVPGLAADEDAPHRARRRRCVVVPRPRTFLAGGRSLRSGRWPSRVCMTGRPVGAPGGEQRAVRLDRPAQLRDVVAEHLAEAARLEEIALHVDDAAARRFRDRARRDTARRRSG